MGFSKDLSFSNNLRKQGKSNEAFEIMLSALTEALFNSVISITNTNKEMTRILGITDETLTVLKKRYNIKKNYSDNT